MHAQPAYVHNPVSPVTDTRKVVVDIAGLNKAIDQRKSDSGFALVERTQGIEHAIAVIQTADPGVNAAG